MPWNSPNVLGSPWMAVMLSYTPLALSTCRPSMKSASSSGVRFRMFLRTRKHSCSQKGGPPSVGGNVGASVGTPVGWWWWPQWCGFRVGAGVGSAGAAAGVAAGCAGGTQPGIGLHCHQ